MAQAMEDALASRRIYFAIALGLMGACATNRSGNEAALSTGRWHAIEIDGRPAVTSGATQRPWLSFQVDSSRVTGFGGCNRLGGPYKQDGSSLTFGALMMTRMACADPTVNAQESAFAAALHDTDHFEISADTLSLLRASTRRARLVR
jgi:putative lipoprotein